jgi:hypothetical protein
MSNRPAEAALLEALRDRRRNGGAIGIVLVVFAVAALVGSSGAFYAASLITFTIWMAWFVLMTIEWIRLAEF